MVPSHHSDADVVENILQQQVKLISNLWSWQYYSAKAEYHIVGNFREEFIFVFFASQKPFTKNETAKFLLAMCKVSEPCFNLAYFQLASRSNSNKSLSMSVPLMAITQAIQEIEVLCNHRRTNWTAEQGREWKQSFLRMSWVRSYFSPPHWMGQLTLPSISVNNSKPSLSF